MTQARAMRWWLGLLAALAALAWSGTAWAQRPDPGLNAANIALQLTADGKPKAGETWTIALRFTPKSREWHGYWSNPGDAGAAMRLQWSLPAGWAAGPPRYPVPQLLEISGLANHVFEGSYTVLVPVEVPRDAQTGGLPPIRLDADYLACTDSICVPERAQVSLDPQAAMVDPRFAGWRSRIAPQLDRSAMMAAAGRMLRIAIPVPATLALKNPHVFVETPDTVAYAAPQRFTRNGDRLIAELPLTQGATMPGQLAGILALGEGEGVRFLAEPGTVPPAGTPVSEASGTSIALWASLLAAFLGGLILNVMPCVFPILSLKALSLVRAGGDERTARRDALAYTAGAVLATVALGALLLVLRAGGEQIGWAFQLQEPTVVVVLLVLAVTLTANFAGLFELPSLALAGRGTSGSGSFATGLLAAFVATPCTGPFMAAALGAALLLPAAAALGLFAALGLGLALPFLLLGFIPALRAWLPRPGPWMERFRRWMALPMGLTALALAWLVWRLGGSWFAGLSLALAGVLTFALMQVWGSSAEKRTGRRRWVMPIAGGIALMCACLLPFAMGKGSQGPMEPGLLDSEPFSDNALSKARAAGPVFVYFTADWCLTCKVNEGAAIERATTKAAFKAAGAAVLRGDWTRRDPAITRFLTAQGVAGVPLYLWYPGGGGPARQLPQVLTPGLLAGLANGSGPPVGPPAGSR